MHLKSRKALCALFPTSEADSGLFLDDKSCHPFRHPGRKTVSVKLKSSCVSIDECPPKVHSGFLALAASQNIALLGVRCGKVQSKQAMEFHIVNGRYGARVTRSQSKMSVF